MYEEKERSWERELRKIKALYENRMKANQQKVEILPRQNHENHNDDNNNNDNDDNDDAGEQDGASADEPNSSSAERETQTRVRAGGRSGDWRKNENIEVWRIEGRLIVKKFLGLTNNFSQRQRREQEEETRALESEAVQLR